MLKNKKLKFLNVFKIKPALIALAFCISFLCSLCLNSSVNSADAGAAGSADDPLVTLSYINKVMMPQIEQLISSKIASIPQNTQNTQNTQITQNTQAAQTATAAPPQTTEQVYQYQQSGGDVSMSSYILIELTKNQKIRAKSGIVELILRPGGTAKIVSSYQTQGIADITSGTEILNGADVPANHSLIIPRADGRGFAVTSAIAYVLARGDYEIVE